MIAQWVASALHGGLHLIPPIAWSWSITRMTPSTEPGMIPRQINKKKCVDFMLWVILIDRKY